MIHIFQQRSDNTSPTFLMLHGIGGSERDLIPLAKKLNPEANVLSVRGRVLENRKTHFFKSSTFDETDLRIRTEELNEFLIEAAERYQFDRGQLVALGYGNGADVAINLLFSYPEALKGAILFHPLMGELSLRSLREPNLVNRSIFIGASHNNAFCPKETTIELGEKFKLAQADVTLHFEHSLHYLTGEIFAASKAWYESTFLK